MIANFRNWLIFNFRLQHALQRLTKRVHCFANPSDVGVDQCQEFHVAQGEFHHVLLTVVTIVGDDQRLLKAKALELCQGVLNGYHVRDITGLLGEGQRLALLDGI